MANYIFSYDLNGKQPTHGEMDKHIKESPYATGRLLETVWYVGASASAEAVTGYLTSILSTNDRYILVTATDMTFQKLLVKEDSLLTAWTKHE
jgi:hypothetical protein